MLCRKIMGSGSATHFFISSKHSRKAFPGKILVVYVKCKAVF